MENGKGQQEASTSAQLDRPGGRRPGRWKATTTDVTRAVEMLVHGGCWCAHSS